MLRVHEKVAVVKHACPDQVPNNGEGLRQDRFYYGLIPSLRDVLSFTMADLPEREEADTSSDTLYHLAKKLEVHHQPHGTAKGGTLSQDNVHVGPFQTEILKGRAARAPAYHTHVMIMPIRHAEMESGKAHPLPPGLQVLQVYTTLTAGSKHVSIVV